METTGVRSIAEVLGEATKVLAAAGCDTPRTDAETIVSDALGLDPSEMSGTGRRAVTKAAARLIEERIDRRRKREPVEYITGRCRFRNLDLAVDRRVLVPQPEFGPLVDAALPLPQGARVHDVGTGSGAIALAIKSERGDLVVSGSDISPAAITVARANAASLDLDVEFSVERGLPPGDYALVMANLPFQDEAGLTLDLAPEFTDYQPHVAVFAGPDGLEVIRAVLREIPTGTRVATSSAPSQAAAVRALFADSEELPGGTAQIVFTVGLVA